MKRLLAWMAGAAGGLAAYRALRRRPHEPSPLPDARADELRARLAEARAAEPEPPAEEPEPADPDARRRSVHERARGTIDEMRG